MLHLILLLGSLSWVNGQWLPDSVDTEICEGECKGRREFVKPALSIFCKRFEITPLSILDFLIIYNHLIIPLPIHSKISQISRRYLYSILLIETLRPVLDAMRDYNRRLL